jgi:type II secretory pathway component PulM
MTKRILSASLIVVFLVISTPGSQAAPSTDARIAQLEKQVATLRSEVNELKALQKQAIYLKNCVAKEKSTNNLKVALRLASCTVEYFKKSKEAEAKPKK